MKAIDVRQMTDEELVQFYDDTNKELFNLRLQQSLGQLEKPDRVKSLRRDIARANTIMSQRRLEAKAAGSSTPAPAKTEPQEAE